MKFSRTGRLGGGSVWCCGCSAYVASSVEAWVGLNGSCTCVSIKAVYNRCDKKLIHVKKINMLSKTEQNDEHFRASLQYHYGLYDVVKET